MSPTTISAFKWIQKSMDGLASNSLASSCAEGDAGGERWYIVANYYGRSRAYVTFQVRLTPELKERLMKRSFETGLSQVAIVNQALENYFVNVALEVPDSPPTTYTGEDGTNCGNGDDGYVLGPTGRRCRKPRQSG